MVSGVPERVHEYRNHHLDSTRWDGFVARDDDIVVTTAYKAGTTWTQRIVASLLLGPVPIDLLQESPWIDARFHGPVEPILARLDAQQHRRFMKSHLAADGTALWLTSQGAQRQRGAGAFAAEPDSPGLGTRSRSFGFVRCCPRNRLRR